MKYILLVLALIPVLGFSQENKNVDKIVAKIDNYYILKSEVETLVARSKENGQEVDRCQAFESLVVQKLLVAKAELDSVIVDDDVIKSQLDARMGEMIRIYGNEKNIVQQFGKSVETLKSELRLQVKEQLTSDKMRQSITEKIDITPNDVANFFNEIPVDSLPTFPAEVTLAQIVRLGKVTEEQKQYIISKLKDYKKQVEGGANFGDLAKEFSEDPGSKPQGGDLGWSKRGQMVPEFEAAAMSMDSGQISGVVESKFGYHLIQTLELRGQEYRARHILLRPDYSIIDMTKPTEYLDSINTLLKLDSLKFDKIIKVQSEDDQTKDAGGIIIDPNTGSPSMPLDASMEPNLYFAINSLEVGDVTKPQNFRTQEGQTGMRIIKLVEKKKEHKANLKDDYEKLKVYAQSQKQNLEVDRWFKNAISEVFINIDPEYEGCRLFQQ